MPKAWYKKVTAQSGRGVRSLMSLPWHAMAGSVAPRGSASALRGRRRPRRGLAPLVEAMEDRTALSPLLFAGDRRGRLFTVDVPTGDVAVRGTMARPMYDIAFDPAGALYGVDARRDLYRIDPSNAAATR